jgi:hypothetical protein
MGFSALLKSLVKAHLLSELAHMKRFPRLALNCFCGNRGCLHLLPTPCLGMGGKRQVRLYALMNLCERLLAAPDVLAERFHVLRQFVATFLHGLALGAVFDRVVVDRCFGFLDLVRKPGVFRLKLLIEGEQVVEVF